MTMFGYMYLFCYHIPNWTVYHNSMVVAFDCCQNHEYSAQKQSSFYLKKKHTEVYVINFKYKFNIYFGPFFLCIFMDRVHVSSVYYMYYEGRMLHVTDIINSI